MTLLRRFLFLAFVAGLLARCGDDAEPGPKGDKGETGPKGDKGDTGETGTANVLYSDWFALNTAEEKFAEYVNPSTNRLVYEFHAPEITQEVLDKGLVVAFFTYDGYVRSMPIVNYLGFDINIELYAIAESKLQISMYEEGFQPTESSVQIVEDEPLFRYIIIPGGNPISASGRIAAPVNYHDYEAVKAYFNIPD